MVDKVLHSKEFESFINSSNKVLKKLNVNSKEVARLDKILNFADWADLCLKFRESELKFRKVFELNPLPVCLVSGSGYFIEVNKKCEELWGYSREELINGMRWQDMTIGPDLKIDEDKIAELKKDAKGEIFKQSVFKEYIKKDGSLILCYLQYSAVRDSNGEVLYFISLIVSEDIVKEYLNKFKQVRKERKDGLFN